MRSNETMKEDYPQYGRRTAGLAAQLTLTDRDILERFLLHCRMSAAPRRLKKIRSYLLQFRDVSEKPLDAITKDDAIAFWGVVKNAPFEEHTKIDIRKIVKRFLKWQYRDLDMLEPLRIPSTHLYNKKKINKPALFTLDEIRRMLRRADRVRDKALLLVLYEAGARPEEATNLRWKDVNWDAKEVHLYSHKKEDDRTVPVFEAVDLLQEWHDEWVFDDPQPNDFVFPSLVGSRPLRDKPISVTYVNRLLKRIACSAGIKRDVWTNLFRHTRLTDLKLLGVEGLVHNKFAGHKPGSKQGLVYVHLDDEDMKKIVRSKVSQQRIVASTQRQRYDDRINALEQRNGQLEAGLQQVVEHLRQTTAELIQIKEKLTIVSQSTIVPAIP